MRETKLGDNSRMSQNQYGATGERIEDESNDEMRTQDTLGGTIEDACRLHLEVMRTRPNNERGKVEKCERDVAGVDCGQTVVDLKAVTPPKRSESAACAMQPKCKYGHKEKACTNNARWMRIYSVGVM